MVQIPTFQNISSKFRQEILLGNRLIILTITWNSRQEAWYMSLADESNSLVGIKLVPNWLLLRQYQALMPFFKGDFLMIKIDESLETEITYTNLNSSWGFFYLDEFEAEEWEVENGF